MKARSIVDSLNQRTMSSVVDEYSAIATESLGIAETNALASIVSKVRNKRILDIGVGAGRTVPGLREISADYVGVDYVQEMVDHCRSKFPGVRFEKADARSMPQFADRSFDLIVFACNGISMVDHEGRLAILKEVRRLLAPGGFFVFSTCNRNSPEHRELFTLPKLPRTSDPVRFVVRALRFLAQTAYRLLNRLRYKKHEVSADEYAIVNDVAHHYRTMLYFITLAAQRQQLKAMGFDYDAPAYDLRGNLVVDDSADGTLTLVASPAALHGDASSFRQSSENAPS